MGRRAEPVLAFLFAFFAFLCALAAGAAPARAFALDGDFSDWGGAAGLADPEEGYPGYDLLEVKWGVNPGEESLYFYARRVPTRDPRADLYVEVPVDADDDGSWDGPADRRILAYYRPAPGWVSVHVLTPDGREVGGRSGKWGEKANAGGGQLEFMATFQELGIVPGQTVRFYFAASPYSSLSPQDRAPDDGSVQYAPFAALGRWAWLPALAALPGLVRRWKAWRGGRPPWR